jgi:rod shape-determining protein MreD
MEHYLRSALIVLLLLILQTTFIQFISIEGFLPDLLLVWLVYTAIRYGQIEAVIAGFVVGLAQDLLATHLLGLAALAKTITGFLAGYTFNENKTTQTLGTYRFISLVLLFSIIHNLIYFSIFYLGVELSFITSVLISSIGIAIYTTVIGVLVMFYMSRQYVPSSAQ